LKEVIVFYRVKWNFKYNLNDYPGATRRSPVPLLGKSLHALIKQHCTYISFDYVMRRQIEA